MVSDSISGFDVRGKALGGILLLKNSRQSRCGPVAVATSAGILYSGVSVATVFLLASSFVEQANAREWYWEASVGTTGEYDDNIRLDPEEPEDELDSGGIGEDTTDSNQSLNEPLGSVTGLVLETTLTLGSATGRDNFAFNIGGDLSRYSENELDSDNFFVDFYSSYLRARSTFEFLAGFDRDSTINTEFDETGLLQEVSQRDKTTVAPSFSYRLSESNTIDAGYTHEDISFANQDEDGPFDFEEDSVFATFTHILNSRTDVFIESEITQFESPDNNNSESDDFEISAGISRQLSETLSGRLSIGRQSGDRKETIENERISSSDSGLIFDTGLDWVFPLLTISAGLSRSLESTGLGQRSERTKATLDVSREISEKFQLFLKTSLNDDSFAASIEEDERPDRRFYSIEPGFNWQLTTNWDLNSSYTYRKQKFDSIGSDGTDDELNASTLSGKSADSNAIQVTLRYRWPRKPL